MLNQTTGTLTPNPSNVIRYNNQSYIVNINLLNTDGDVYPVNVSGLVSLSIEDNSELWYKTATLIISNPENILERKISSYPGYIPFKFRNDGRDLVTLQILPILEDSIKSTDIEPYYLIDYVFSVCNKEEIMTGPSLKDKCLKLFLWEFDYQRMIEQNVSWSTNELLPSNVIPSQVTDEERLVYTGDALKSLIKRGLEGTEQKFSTTNWDKGSSKIFYDSFANNSCAEDLTYLLKKHVSSSQKNNTDGEPCVLIRNRYSKIWNLISYSKLFSYACQNNSMGELQSEVFKLPSTATDSLQNIPAGPKLPSGQSVTFPVNSIIKNFEIVDMAAEDNTTFMVDMPCYSNNFTNKTFNLDYTDNTITSLKKYMQENFTNVFTYNPNSKTLITLNKVKKESRSLINAYSYARTKTERFADSRNLLLRSALFLNLCISFKVPGTSYRQSNTFIGINRQSPDLDNTFDNKLLGQWLVTSVIHNFTSSEYTNSIIAVKLHTSDDPFISETSK